MSSASLCNCVPRQNIDYFLIKWEGWSSVFNSWEPRSNLGCDKLVTEFLQSGSKQSAVADDSEESKRIERNRKIWELVDVMLCFEPDLTAVGLIDLYAELDPSKVGYSTSEVTCSHL